MKLFRSPEDFVLLKKYGLSTLGMGSTGTVQLVCHKPSKQGPYAMKKMHLPNPEEAEYVRKEIKLHSGLKHPHIIQLIDYFFQDDHAYVFMEYGSEGDLFKYMRRTLSVPMSSLLRIFSEIVCGVEYLHSRNIIHRDIKPENIILTSTLGAKICDFGWSIECGEYESRRTICGTPEYMSPELLIHGSQNKKSDIYALGVLLFEMLHKRPPFSGRRVEDVKRKIEIGKIMFKRGLEEDLKNLLLQMLETDPHKRIDFEGIKGHRVFEEYFGESTEDRKKKDSKKSIRLNDFDYQNGFQKLDFRKKANSRTQIEKRKTEQMGYQNVKNGFGKQKQIKTKETVKRLHRPGPNIETGKLTSSRGNRKMKDNQATVANLKSGNQIRQRVAVSVIVQDKTGPSELIDKYMSNGESKPNYKTLPIKYTQETGNLYDRDIEKKGGPKKFLKIRNREIRKLDEFWDKYLHIKDSKTKDDPLRLLHDPLYRTADNFGQRNRNVAKHQNKQSSKQTRNRAQVGNQKKRLDKKRIKVKKEGYSKNSRGLSMEIGTKWKSKGFSNQAIQSLVIDQQKAKLKMDLFESRKLDSDFQIKYPDLSTKKYEIKKNKRKNNLEKFRQERWQKGKWMEAGIVPEQKSRHPNSGRNKGNRFLDNSKRKHERKKNQTQSQLYSRNNQMVEISAPNFSQVQTKVKTSYTDNGGDLDPVSSHEIGNFTSIAQNVDFYGQESKTHGQKRKNESEIKKETKRSIYQPKSKTGMPLKRERSRSHLKKQKHRQLGQNSSNFDHKSSNKPRNFRNGRNTKDLVDSLLVSKDSNSESGKKESTALFEDYEPFQDSGLARINLGKYGLKKRIQIDLNKTPKTKPRQNSKSGLKSEKILEKQIHSTYFQENLIKSERKDARTPYHPGHTSAGRKKKIESTISRRNYNISIDLGNLQGLPNRMRVISVEYKRPVNKIKNPEPRLQRNQETPNPKSSKKSSNLQIVERSKSRSRFRHPSGVKIIRALSKDNIISKRKISREPSTDKMYLDHLQRLLSRNKSINDSHAVKKYLNRIENKKEVSRNEKKLGKIYENRVEKEFTIGKSPVRGNRFKNVETSSAPRYGIHKLNVSPSGKSQKIRAHRVLTEPNGSAHPVGSNGQIGSSKLKAGSENYFWGSELKKTPKYDQTPDGINKIFTKKISRIQEYSEITITPEDSHRDSKKRIIFSALPSPGKSGLSEKSGFNYGLNGIRRGKQFKYSLHEGESSEKSRLVCGSRKNPDHTPLNPVVSPKARSRQPKEGTVNRTLRKQKQFKAYLRKEKNPSLSEQVHDNKMMKYKRGPMIMMNQEMRRSSPLKEVGKVMTLKMSTSHTRLGVTGHELGESTVLESVRPMSSVVKDTKPGNHKRMISTGHIRLKGVMLQNEIQKEENSDNFQTFGKINIVKNYCGQNYSQNREKDGQPKFPREQQKITTKPKKSLREKLLIVRSQSSQILKHNPRSRLKRNLILKDQKVKNDNLKRKFPKETPKKNRNLKLIKRPKYEISEKKKNLDSRKSKDLNKFFKIDLRSERRRPTTVLKGKTLMEEYTERMKRGSSPSISLNTYYKLPKGTKLKKKTPKK